VPTLTTAEGIQITFAAKAVSMLTDHDASTGQAFTCVYGVTNGLIRISESVPGFMLRLKMAQNFAQLTRANGSPIWINGGAVSSIRAPLPNEYVAGVNTVVSLDSFMQGVRETPDEVTTLINAHGGEL
jgi:uncharacterized protein YlzI (FlbEa/FlbD family)